MNTNTRFYLASNVNMPQLNDSYGCLVALLDACLVTGVSVQSVASMQVAGGQATLNFSSAHGYMAGQVLEIMGAGTGYNGLYRIAATSANSLSFALSASDASISGASVRLPPLGYEKLFEDVPNKKRVYRSLHPAASGILLRVDNGPDPAYNSGWAKYAKVGMADTMSDINTFTGVQAPYNPANPSLNWVGSGSGTSAVIGWARWYYARDASMSNSDAIAPETGNRKFVLVGDGRTFYLITPFSVGGSYNQRAIYGFGDFDSIAPAQKTALLISTLGGNPVNSGPSWPSRYNSLLQSTPSIVLLGQSISISNSAAAYPLARADLAPVSAHQDVMTLLRVGVQDMRSNPAVLQGFMRGLTTPVSSDVDADIQVVTGMGAPVLMVAAAKNDSSVQQYCTSFDLGDWS